MSNVPKVTFGNKSNTNYVYVILNAVTLRNSPLTFKKAQSKD